MVQDARKFLISSDYPMDLVVWSTSGEKVVAAQSWSTLDILHGLPFKPLFFGLYSIDGGNTWVALDVGIANGADLYPQADSTKVSIEIHSRVQTTLKYKIWAYAPSNASSEITPPSSENTFRINSDRDYLKLVKADIWNAVAGEDTVFYNHNLGYKPWAMMWFEYTDGTIHPPLFVKSGNASLSPNRCVSVDDNSLRASFTTLAINADDTLKAIHYRVYADEIGETYV